MTGRRVPLAAARFALDKALSRTPLAPRRPWFSALGFGRGVLLAEASTATTWQSTLVSTDSVGRPRRVRVASWRRC